MDSKQFVQWLRGFTEGVHGFNVTPAQWDLLKDRLSQVNDEDRSCLSITPAKEGFGYYKMDPNGTSTYNTVKKMLND